MPVLSITCSAVHSSNFYAGETISAEYKLEYGTDKIEMHVGAVKKGQRVLLVDDLIATGGTLAAGISLMETARLLTMLRLCLHSLVIVPTRCRATWFRSEQLLWRQLASLKCQT